MSSFDSRAFKSGRYLSLATYRASGVEVRTPVWFAVSSAHSPAERSGVLYVYTGADSGKIKRLRRDGRVRIALCDMRGKITGPWSEARAVIVTGSEAEAGMALLGRKYWPWKQMLDLSVRFSPRHQRAVIAIRPD